MNRTALILFAHGAREREWAAPLEGIRDRIAAQRPELRVELAFLEIMTPPLPQMIAQLAGSGHNRILVAPVFLARGGHLKRDVPQLLDEARQRFPHVTIELLPVLGEIDSVLEAAAAWLARRAQA
jgi:sirohydrochlorin cobaltochelatase